MFSKFRPYSVPLLIAGLALALPVNAKTKAKPVPAPEPVTRPYAKPDSFLATSVPVPAGYALVYLSGALADVADPAAPKGTVAAYGNTETQTESVLTKLQAALA